jgi:glycosyltransferase involved in cell wall biosynthesis
VPTSVPPARVLFLNTGILGLQTYHAFLKDALTRQSRIAGDLVLLTDHLTVSDRVIRRILTQRCWRDGWFALSNLDLARFRAELNTGLHARRLLAARSVERYDVLHFHRQSAAWGSIDVMRRVPSIVSIDATQDAVMATASRALERATYELNARVDGAVFGAAAAIVSTSRWAADCLRARYPEVKTPLHVLPPPVALSVFDPRWIEERRTRRAEGAKPRVLFIGGDFPRKGGFELLRAWVAGGFTTRAELVIVSDWPIRSVPEGVRVLRGVLAFSEAWVRCWRDADLFVMPTKDEAFGLVYQEAAAAGLPAIGTRLNAIPEIIDDGSTGILLPVGDGRALVQALDRLIGDPALRDRLGANARARIEEVGDPDTHMDRLASIVEAVSAVRPAPLR